MNISTLGLMKKTGSIITGFDASVRELQADKSKAAGIALAKDLSEKSKKEIIYMRDKYRSNIKIVTLNADMEEIGKVLGKKTGIVLILDGGFWQSVSKDLNKF